eukprot:9843417-Lingulodinium_polyedra.AAC.1
MGQPHRLYGGNTPPKSRVGHVLTPSLGSHIPGRSRYVQCVQTTNGRESAPRRVLCQRGKHARPLR